MSGLGRGWEATGLGSRFDFNFKLTAVEVTKLFFSPAIVPDEIDLKVQLGQQGNKLIVGLQTYKVML